MIANIFQTLSLVGVLFALYFASMQTAATPVVEEPGGSTLARHD